MGSLRNYNMLLNKFHNVGGVKRLYTILDLIVCRTFLGANSADYFKYQFWKKSWKERDTFIYSRRHKIIYTTCNGISRNPIFDSKELFMQKFRKYVRRDYISLVSSSFEMYQSFAEKHPVAFAKPESGTYGIGTSVLHLDGSKEQYNLLVSNSTLLEELIIGDDEIQEFNPTSLNTIRVVTLIDAEGKVKIMSAGLRIGNGEAVADNFHHGGLATIINIHSGFIISDGVDHNLVWYKEHPVSGKTIRGFKIPFWDKVIETIKNAAMVMPEVRYVGWDVAVGKNGKIYIIEGNCCADPDVSQIPDQKGKWFMYKEELRRIKDL